MTVLRVMLGLLIALKIASASVPAAFDQTIATDWACGYDRPAVGPRTVTTGARTCSTVRLRSAFVRTTQGHNGFRWKADCSSWEFTGKERDNETGLDYFGARYFSGAQGRFTSPDPFNPILEFQPQSDDPDDIDDARQGFDNYIANPQQWNRYAYALNNPTKFIDRDGRIAILPILAAAYEDYEVGSAIYDAYTTYKTVRDPSASRTEKVAAVTGLGISLVGPGGGYGTAGRAGVKALESHAGKEIVGQIHHIAADKNIKGGFTAAFEKVFSKAGLSLQDPLNKVFLEGLKGRHSAKYHQYVLDEVTRSTRGLSGDSYKRALQGTLQRLRKELEENPDLVRGIGL